MTNTRIGAAAILLAVGILGATATAAEQHDRWAADVLDASGVEGGLVVHLGCGFSLNTAALRVNDAYLVQGFDRDAEAIAKRRLALRAHCVYGPVAIDVLTGDRLPLIDGSVNLIIDEMEDGPDREEMLRVLAPGGVLLSPSADGWTKTVKPIPEAIDEWTHFLHDASNNAVARDDVVGPPRRMQWIAGPRYSRHHDRMSSVSAVVSAGGRVFTIIDEATAASALAPPKWRLVARDAFNGKTLWKQDIASWHTHLWPLKSGPANLPRRLVAVGDRVYASLAWDGPLTELDAATGEILREFDGTAGTEEIVHPDGLLLALVNPNAETPEFANSKMVKGGYGMEYWKADVSKKIVAIDPATGKTLWTHESPVLPTTMAADEQSVVFADGLRIVCLDRATGDVRWSSQEVPRSQKLLAYYSPTLVLVDGVAIFSGGEMAGTQTGSWYEKGEDTMTAVSAQTGEVLWKAYHPPSGYRSAEDLLVVNGVVWCGETTSGRVKGVFTGRDLHTGEVVAEFTPDVDTYWFHHRCYRGKATENYLLMSRTGIEFLDLEEESWSINHWVRGACLYGVMPANGLVYAPQHPCACYLETKLSGFSALAPAKDGPRVDPTAAAAPRLETFAEYDIEAEAPSPLDWPTYRHDASRSGTSDYILSTKLIPDWRTKLGGKLSAPTAAAGMVFVAQVDEHAVHALDAERGHRRWSFTAGGRVDSPPTYHKGRVLFGSADGYVYCLSAADGQILWRFRAAPIDERLTVHDQLESAWPVHGSILVLDDVAYFAAGRSTFVDGGLTLWRLNALTGEILSQTVLDAQSCPDDENPQSYVSWLNMPPGLPDILSSDGRYVYMRSQPFTMDGRRLPLEAMPTRGNADAGAPDPDQNPEYAHLFSPTGYLDDTNWHRTYWMWGSRFVSGWCGYYRSGKAAPAGKLLLVDGDDIYGFGRKPQFYRWTVPIEHHLFAATKESIQPSKIEDEKERTSFLVDHRWSKDLPIFVRAMTLAGKRLILAGPRDVVDETAAFQKIAAPETREALDAHAASLSGENGALLLMVDTDGETLLEQPLAAPPIFDGMAVADRRLIVCTTDGVVHSYEGEE